MYFDPIPTQPIMRLQHCSISMLRPVSSPRTLMVCTNELAPFPSRKPVTVHWSYTAPCRSVDVFSRVDRYRFLTLAVTLHIADCSMSSWPPDAKGRIPGGPL